MAGMDELRLLGNEPGKTADVNLDLTPAFGCGIPRVFEFFDWRTRLTMLDEARGKHSFPKIPGTAAFPRRFGENTDCVHYIRSMRWGDDLEEFVCPDCNHEHGWWLPKRGLVECCGCHRQTSPTAGTVFHRSRVPLWKWFWAMHLLANRREGVSAMDLAGHANVCYQTAWTMLHKLREAMRQRCEVDEHEGLAEIDEADAKRAILGKYHSVSPKHLDRYLAAFKYQANRRWTKTKLFDRLVVAAVDAKPLTFKELTTGAK